MNNTKNSRYALITGGGSGLGREFCCHLASQGWHVAVADVDPEGAEETLAILRDRGGQGQVELLDVSDFTAWQSLVGRLRTQWPRLDLLVNNAGICGAGTIGEYPLGDFRRILDVNLFGVVHGCYACVPWLLETAPGGCVVNVASIAASLNAPTMSAYCASKAGVIAFSESLYGELLAKGVHVTVVIPGFFRSELLQQGRFEDDRLREIAERYTRNANFIASDVVIETMKSIERRRLYVVHGSKARLAWRLKRLAPARFHRFVIRSFDKDSRKIRRDG